MCLAIRSATVYLRDKFGGTLPHFRNHEPLTIIAPHKSIGMVNGPARAQGARYLSRGRSFTGVPHEVHGNVVDTLHSQESLPDTLRDTSASSGDEVVVNGPPPVRHRHDDVSGTVAHADIVDIARVDDVRLGGVELLIRHLAEGSPDCGLQGRRLGSLADSCEGAVSPETIAARQLAAREHRQG